LILEKTGKSQLIVTADAMECGGKRSATLLSTKTPIVPRICYLKVKKCAIGVYKNPKVQYRNSKQSQKPPNAKAPQISPFFEFLGHAPLK
jgi:hypothetical protein